MTSESPLITLTTDFGTADSYVAQMKGILLGIQPQARLVDVTHEIPPQDVLRAALMLPELIEAFPKGTYHLIVVDPGVGTSRKILAAEINDQRFIAPDNGLLDPLLKRYPKSTLYELTNSKYWRESVCSTFHGRDIMAPAIANWSRGVSLQDLGSELNSIVELDLPQPQVTDSQVIGTILYVDHFGNLVSNIRREHLKSFEKRTADPLIRLERDGSLRFIDSGISQTYADPLPGHGLILWGSSGYLEVALHGGDAARKMKSKPGETLSLDWRTVHERI
ncbi:MAG: SAM-dependent chlorinase/fluorinase [Planctomycetaceae bacterium]